MLSAHHAIADLRAVELTPRSMVAFGSLSRQFDDLARRLAVGRSLPDDETAILEVPDDVEPGPESEELPPLLVIGRRTRIIRHDDVQGGSGG